MSKQTLKLSKQELIALNKVWELPVDEPANVKERLVHLIVKKVASKFKQKEFKLQHRYELSLDDYQLLALREYLQKIMMLPREELRDLGFYEQMVINTTYMDLDRLLI